jgi:oligoribonuclease NrnB/cAMP/cGMP phosphodiesterase (DHH superfamily)
MYKLLSHNDLDGVGCGILAKLAFGKQVDVRYNSISGLDRQVERFFEKESPKTFLFITDLSVNEENEKKIEQFYRDGGKVQLIDHHRTALSFNDYDWGYVAVEEEPGKLASATSLFYDYLVRNELLEARAIISEFVELIRQYDTWEWEKNDNQRAKRLNSLFFLIAIETFEEEMINRLKQDETSFHFDDFEKRLLDMEDKKIERYITRKRRQLTQTEVNGKFAGVVHAESYHSELGNELGKEYPHLDYIVIINMGGKRAGFRTIHDHTDVSEVAAYYGGGGHAKASGCMLTREAYKHFVDDIFEYDPLWEDARQNRNNLKGTPSGTLYTNRSNDCFFIYEESDHTWMIEKNKTGVEQVFTSFAEAEKMLKRQEQAWLVKDDVYAAFLKERAGKV